MKLRPVLRHAVRLQSSDVEPLSQVRSAMSQTTRDFHNSINLGLSSQLNNVDDEFANLKNTKLKFRGSDFDFPCLNKRFIDGPEPAYQKVVTGFKHFRYNRPFSFYYNDGLISEFELAYETWGELNESRSNAILLYTGLSASSHARSHKAMSRIVMMYKHGTHGNCGRVIVERLINFAYNIHEHDEDNKAPGWWENFIGPGCALDTDKFFVVCVNQIGGCYGSTGPSSVNPVTGTRYGTNFPMISVKDMIEVQRLLLEHLGISKLYAAVGASLGGMCSVAMASFYPHMVSRLVSLSAGSNAHPRAIAYRYLQRRCIMEDPLWNRGHYYEGEYPLKGTKLAREIATLTYRSGLEWEQRFGRTRIPTEPPSLCHNFEIEQYIEYQGLQHATKLDANTLLYLSKAMDLFDLKDFFDDNLQKAMKRITCPTLIMGITTDVLFPVQQQRDLAENLKRSGNDQVVYYELNSIYGHDTFLLDLTNVGTAMKGFLETNMAVSGHLAKHAPV